MASAVPNKASTAQDDIELDEKYEKRYETLMKGARAVVPQKVTESGVSYAVPKKSGPKTTENESGLATKSVFFFFLFVKILICLKGKSMSLLQRGN